MKNKFIIKDNSGPLFNPEQYLADIARILEHMDGILWASHDKAVAARLIREQWDPKMDVAFDKAKIALAKWIVDLHSISL